MAPASARTSPAFPVSRGRRSCSPTLAAALSSDYNVITEVSQHENRTGSHRQFSRHSHSQALYRAMRAGRDRLVAGQKRLPDHLSGTPATPGLGRCVPRLKPRRGRRTHAGNHEAQRLRPYGVAVVGGPQRDEVWLVTLDPTHGAEIQKTR